MPDPSPRLTATTREIAPIDDPLPFADPRRPLAWLRHGQGMAARGLVLRLDADGTSREPRARSLARRWRDLCENAVVDDPVGLAGTGLVAFGAFAFDDASQAPSTLIVPRTIVGVRDGRSWATDIRLDGVGDAGPDAGDDTDAASFTPYGPYWSATLGPGALDPDGYQNAVRAGLEAVADGQVGKVVLARDLVGTVPASADLRRLVRELCDGYPDTWCFAVDGIMGASPETLVGVHGGDVTARVLAGTRPRGADDVQDAAAAAALEASHKDLDEHRFAVHSVVESLAPHAATLSADEHPFPLQLPNVWHLATDVRATLSDGSTALDLVQALHPTAAVAGTPRQAAVDAIRRIEPFDRMRYAGPVGWVDGRGDGEWAIALRCAQFDATAVGDVMRVVAHAGAGIVAGSDPDAELRETRVKFRPVIDALA